LKFEVKPYGADAVLLSFGDEISLDVHNQVKQLYAELRNYAKKGIRAVIPSYCAVTILFEPAMVSLNEVVELSENIVDNNKGQNYKKYKVRIPVCYDKHFALDWEVVCDYTGLKWEEVVELHCRNEYLVYMLGFIPGFLYLGGLNDQIRIPRKSSPRLKIPKGSVGLADNQTGVYPLETPGGWQLIGNAPVDLIGVNTAVVEMGDYLEFFPITKKQHASYSKQIERILVNET